MTTPEEPTGASTPEQHTDWWGDPISAERQAELDALAVQQRTWAEQPAEARGDSPLGGVRLTGAEVFWLAKRALAGPDGDAAALADAGKHLLQDPTTYLTALHLEGANLGRTRLEGAGLFQAQLQGADLFQAQLAGVFLVRAHLEGASLYAAHLEGAFLRQAHLEGADLRFAHLQRADLLQAHLRELTSSRHTWRELPSAMSTWREPSFAMSTWMRILSLTMPTWDQELYETG